MNVRVAIPVIAAVCLIGAADAQKVAKPQKTPAAAKPSPVISAPVRGPEPKPGGGPASPQNLEKLLKMTPEQRNKALSALPPARRQQVLNKLEQYQKIPPRQRARELDQLQRLQSLPPPKRAQVRASLRKFQEIPEPRHKLIKKQIDQFNGLSDADRRGVMNSEEFRNKFTPAEQEMIKDISLVTPRG